MSTTAPPTAGRREWIGLAVLALPTLLVSMDLTILHLTTPSLTADLAPSNTQLLWIVDIYGFLVAGLLLVMGTLGDRIGRRRLLLIGGAAFGLTSILAAFSTSAEMLILSRALLGVAGATLMPSTLSLIRTMFHDPAQRTAATSVWASCFAVGNMIGPLVGGVMLEFFWWGSVFLIAVPVMVALLVFGPRLLPEHHAPAGRVDLVSAVLSLASVLGIIYGLKLLAEDGFQVAPVAYLVAGLLVGALFLRRQRTLDNPLLELALFRERTFSAALFLLTTATLIMGGAQLLIMQYLQLVGGLSPMQAGLWSLPIQVGFIIGAMGAPALLGRVKLGQLLGGGMIVVAVGLLMIYRIDSPSDVLLAVAGSAVIGLGLGPLISLGTSLIVGAAPPERAGSAAAISETGTELGAALGIALLGSLGFAVYRNELEGPLPAGLSAEQAEAARETLGGAVTLAEELGGETGDALLDVARYAFIEGFQTTSIVSAVVAVGLALIAFTVLRNVMPGEEDDSADAGVDSADATGVDQPRSSESADA